jgi:glycosyltransferase involved in cell wall biosynthesis
MRIALDARIVAQSNTGIARYAIGLSRAWQRVFPEDTWVYVTHRLFDPAEHGLDPSAEILHVPFPNQSLIRPVWETWMLPRAIRGLSPKPDLFFSPLGAVVPGAGIPSVATIHDLAFMRYPEILPARYRIYWNWVISRAARHADRIIAVSDSTVRDISELTEADPRRVVRVYEGLDEGILTEPSGEEIGRLRDRFGLPASFLLFVGTLEPRKNVLFLLDIYEQLMDRGIPLVLAGDWGWLSDPIRRRVAELSPNVLPAGHLSIGDLACLYRMATVFLFPSLYEGFGLPLLEAMATGLPVVAVRSSSVPEVLGDAGILVEAGDRETFVREVGALLDDPRKRQELSAKGLARAKEFSWQGAAIETRDVFQGLLSS